MAVHFAATIHKVAATFSHSPTLCLDFADKRRSLGWYSSLEDYGHGV
jgi:hypothetical protein